MSGQATLAAVSAAGAGGGSLVFFVGSHQPHWLWRTSMPLMVSRRALQRRSLRGLRPATCRWVLDSGGFTELALHGRWTVSPQAYAEVVAAYAERLGGLVWAAPQDWMCEPVMLARTGLTVAEHQRRTVDNFLQLRELAPGLPFVPVVQGWTPAEYVACVELYAAAGVDLATEPLVGVGSVCRRQATTDAGRVLAALHGVGVRRLHGFGFKVEGLHRHGRLLVSADSLAWSFRARCSPALPGCTGHKNCANCLTYATRWHAQALAGLTAQPALFDATAPATGPGGGS